MACTRLGAPPKNVKKGCSNTRLWFYFRENVIFCKGGGHALEEIGQKMPRLKNFFLAISEGFKKKHFVLLKKKTVFLCFFKKPFLAALGLYKECNSFFLTWKFSIPSFSEDI